MSSISEVYTINPYLVQKTSSALEDHLVYANLPDYVWTTRKENQKVNAVSEESIDDFIDARSVSLDIELDYDEEYEDYSPWSQDYAERLGEELEYMESLFEFSDYQRELDSYFVGHQEAISYKPIEEIFNPDDEDELNEEDYRLVVIENKPDLEDFLSQNIEELAEDDIEGAQEKTISVLSQYNPRRIDEYMEKFDSSIYTDDLKE